MTNVYLLRGRSIDGTVYATTCGWTPSLGYAHACMTEVGANGLLAEAEFANKLADLDHQIGWLTVVPVNRDSFNKAQGDAFEERMREADEDDRVDPIHNLIVNALTQSSPGSYQPPASFHQWNDTVEEFLRRAGSFGLNPSLIDEDLRERTSWGQPVKQA